MAPTLTHEIRQAFLAFFQSKHHAIIPGASLVPENDPTVLFTTAGMHPLVPYLLGEPHPRGKRLADAQLCVRTQDIDEVGDASHLTCFEMLGNWSLGDYFKEETIAMSFEFLTNVLGLYKAKIAVSCFAGDKDAPRDTEAAKEWESLGISRNRIAFLPKAKNWWGPAGQTGPCGPDTEMFYWVGKGQPTGNPATNEAGWLEVWNDVFMQYNKIADGMFEPLKQQNVDTGMGLERVAQVMQGVSSVYETDAFRPIMDKLEQLRVASCELQGESETRNPKPETNGARHARIIADHIKAATFIIADGVEPSNVDQGYVLRRLIRRAIRSARTLGIEHSGNFCPSVSAIVIDQYCIPYKQLSDKAEAIKNVLRNEEEQFSKTIKEGMKHLEKTVASLTQKKIDGMSAFHLYDTYGFPLELTKEMAQEQGLAVDEEGFKKAFASHQEKSRKGAEQKFAGGLADDSDETTKLHTATHLLQAALRKVLGEHVYQKGSNVTADRLRFDFPHPEKMTDEQKAQVEKLVNDAIKADLPVSYHVTTVEDAKKQGAIGVFDERYDAEVKVYTVGEGGNVVSKEICGGPHVARTGMIGSFTIAKEESSSAGVRRIKAIVKGGPQKIEKAKEEKRKD